MSSETIETDETIDVEPDYKVQHTDWGAFSISAAAVGDRDDTQSEKSAAQYVSMHTRAWSSIPLLRVAHIPWLVAGAFTILIGAVTGMFTSMDLVTPAIIAAVIVVVAGPYLHRLVLRRWSTPIDLDDPVLVECDNVVAGPLRSAAVALLRRYARGDIEDADSALAVMATLTDMSQVADRLRVAGIAPELIDPVIEQALSDGAELDDSYARLQQMEADLS